MREIGPYILRRPEGRDAIFIDTLTAWIELGHPALLAHKFGEGTPSLVRSRGGHAGMLSVCV